MARPKSEDPRENVQARIPRSKREYLKLWANEEGVALEDMIDRCRKMWPNGPFTPGGRLSRKASPRAKTPKLKAYAAANGMTDQEAIAKIVANFLKTQSGQTPDTPPKAAAVRP